MFCIILVLHSLTLTLVWYLSGVRGPPSSEYNTQPANANSAEESMIEQKNKKCCNKEDCLRFTIYDRIAILFCACQKTAAFGIPIVSSLFESSEYLGIYLVPLLIYHPLQLIIDSFLVQPLSLKVSRYEKAVAIAAGGNDIEMNEVETDGTDTMKDSQISLQSLGTGDDEEVNENVEEVIR